MRAPALGEAATHLPWLSPCAASLVALARSPAAAAWPAIRTDPGAVVLVIRHAPSTVPTTTPLVTPSLLQDPALLEDALRSLDGSGSGFVRWDVPERRPVYRASLAYARLASGLAERSGRCAPDCAWVAGLLAPLGWLALAAVDAAAANACLTDPDWQADPAGVQQRCWGLDQASITRRLCRRWGLPRWLTAVIGHLDLAPPSAAALGAPVELLRVLQLAAAVAQENGVGLSLSVGCTAVENSGFLGLRPADVDAVAAEAHAAETVTVPAGGEPPEQYPLLHDLLLLAVACRRVREDPSREQLEGDVDNLHRALREQRDSEQERLRTLKLAALAEFSAGASHEINNPLAVISGQAQYLLTHEPDPARQRSLHTIIGQAQRIHQILSDLMEFARPSQPDVQTVDASQLVQDVSSSLGELAEQKHVRLDRAAPAAPSHLRGDSRQLQAALTCLLRNAIEAAPADGWASIRLDGQTPDRWDFVVEDNGSGPPPAHREHLFDPFYCGRQAGRGRGLGLPTAWQLARNHGGEVRFDGHEAGVTRFVLSVPRTLEPPPGPAHLPPDGDVPTLPGNNGNDSALNGQIRVHCGP